VNNRINDGNIKNSEFITYSYNNYSLTNTINNIRFKSYGETTHNTSGINKTLLDNDNKILDYEQFGQSLNKIPAYINKRDMKHVIFDYMRLVDRKESIHLLLLKMMKAYTYRKIYEEKYTEQQYTVNIDLLNKTEIGFHLDKIKVHALTSGILHMFNTNEPSNLYIHDANTAGDISMVPFANIDDFEFYCYVIFATLDMPRNSNFNFDMHLPRIKLKFMEIDPNPNDQNTKISK